MFHTDFTKLALEHRGGSAGASRGLRSGCAWRSHGQLAPWLQCPAPCKAPRDLIAQQPRGPRRRRRAGRSCGRKQRRTDGWTLELCALLSSLGFLSSVLYSSLCDGWKSALEFDGSVAWRQLPRV